MKRRTPALRLGLAATLLGLLSTACTNGVNAGKQGGVAFIVFTIMLVVTCVIMWIIIGREQ